MRYLNPAAVCAGCARAAAPPKPAKTIICARCGQRRRNVGHGLCNRCNLADPDRPFRYADALAGRLTTTPAWWQEFVITVAARRHPSDAVTILRETGRLLAAEPVSPEQLLARCAHRGTARALATFFVSRGLAVPPRDEQPDRAAARRQHYLDSVPARLAPAVSEFTRTRLESQPTAQHAGRRPISDTTIECQLWVLRDLALHLAASRPVTAWAEVTTADLDAFVADRPHNRHHCIYVLRAFFGWAKRRRLVLIDPARPLWPGPQPGFRGTVIDVETQRRLFRRWTEHTTHPHERLIGLLALVHAASNQQIRKLTVGDIDRRRHTVRLAGRPHPTVLDPFCWDAIDACITHRHALNTANPNVIVTGRTRAGDQPADSTYLARTIAHAGTTVASCRQTRISQLVTDLDPKLAAAALGMHDTGLVRYLADNVDNDRLHRTPGRPMNPGA